MDLTFFSLFPFLFHYVFVNPPELTDYFFLFVFILMCLTIQSPNLVITADEISRNFQTTWDSPPGAALTSSVFGRKGNLVLRAWLGGCGAGDCL